MNNKFKVTSRPITSEELLYVKEALKKYEQYVEENKEKYEKMLNMFVGDTANILKKLKNFTINGNDFGEIEKYFRSKNMVIPSIKNVLDTHLVYVREDGMEDDEEEFLWFKMTDAKSGKYVVDFLMKNIGSEFLEVEDKCIVISKI